MPGATGNTLNATTAEQRALVVAMELLRAAIGDATVATAANTKRTEEDLAKQARAVGDFADGKAASYADLGPRSGAADIGGPAGGGPSELAQAAQAALAPVAAVGQVLGSLALKFGVAVAGVGVLASALAAPISGLQTFGQAVKTIGTALAPILLPISTLMSTAALAFSEVLTGALAPVMEEWFELILTDGISAIEFFIEVVQGAAQALQDLWDAIPESASDEQSAQVAGDFRNTLRALGLGDAANLIAPEIGAETRLAAGGGEAAEPESGAEGATRRGLADTLRSMRMSMGPRASISGLASVGNQAQLAALNSDPIEARMLKVQQDMLAKLERVANNTMRDRGPAVRTGAGDYERGTSAGGGGDYGEGA